jgi:ABC-type polysaccharide/polyol phosphate transport system ATPase subunit
MNSLTVSEPAPAQAVDFDPQEVAILIEDVSVRFRLSSLKTSSVKEFAINLFKRRVAYRDFWALKEISLKIHKGEIFGLIGHNGAGKSTLLKSVARVLKPTSGRIRVNGKIAPMLSVGAGFHPELTGRENVYLNGTILGFSNRQMEAKFERIVAFAELPEYIDQPLRTYSSGMRARLGFAVATDSKPDVLIIDEVLSVGDEAFREKSARRMRQYQEQGATTVIVSHNMNMIRGICHRAGWIHQGRLRLLGEAPEVIEAYLAERRSSQQS